VLHVLRGKFGVLVEMDMDHVPVTDVSTTGLHQVVHIILRPFRQMVDVVIVYVLVEFIGVVLGNVTVAKDVHPT
tara:strand:- start:6618 stop:6839 length:222 start_codon:yes stop_codon:yes gene_type:complete